MTSKINRFETVSSRNLSDLVLLISDHITAMLAYWDKDLICRYANSAYVEWFGKTKEEMINTIRIDELLGPHLYEKNLPYIKAVLLGKKQLFEREIPIPNGGGIRHSLATYIPDINDGEVIGFFVHVADVTHLKELENTIASAKRETLRKIIETKETEKRHLVEILRENVNQRLVACKMTVESERKKDINTRLYEEVSDSIGGVIQELNLLCQDLAPTEIEILGLIEAIELYLAKSAKRQGKTIDFAFENSSIENLILMDKYSIFRIVQNFITIALNDDDIKNIEVSIQYTEPYVKIKFITDTKTLLNKSSNEYHTIASRIDNYSGKLTEYVTETKNVYEIELPIIKCIDL
ncbi:MAG TPA: PAS domain-containing protein [Chitinophagaceae bacterium]|nr:PAS domain-containing protein [Chitinophagaceae bacterium]